MKPLPWLTAQCVDLEINRRQLVEIQMSTQHTHTQHTTPATKTETETTMKMTMTMKLRRTLIMGIGTVRSSVWQWRWRFVRTASNCLLDAINKTHTDTHIYTHTQTDRDRDTDIDTANGCQNWRRKTAQTEDWQRGIWFQFCIRFRHLCLLSAFGISWVLILLEPQLRPGSLINRILILIFEFRISNFKFKVNSLRRPGVVV